MGFPKHEQKAMSNALAKWISAFEKNQKLKAAKVRLQCRRFWVRWRLQTSLSRHFKNIRSRQAYHSLDEKSKNSFAFWCALKLRKSFERWQRATECAKMRKSNQQRAVLEEWR